ncbi:MAG: DNA polymerase/3'-5' exonuclease PolX [Gammaproteobacteria bacterium]|nr:DNA polymerase/3'-5' exonuclease PolX [Gammaproteobacteria bacterium]
MPVHNADIAAVFSEIADLLEIQGANAFRVRAYRNAARAVNGYGRDLASLIGRGEAVPKLPGIGADLGAKLEEIARTGHSAFLDHLHKDWPAAVTTLLEIPGLGPKRVKILYDNLHVHSLEELDAAVRGGRLRSLPGFGPRTEENIRQAVAAHWTKARRFRLAVARPYAEALVAYLQRLPGVRQVVVAGSFRRRQETVGDLDIVVAAKPGPFVTGRFAAYDEVSEVLSSGTTRASVRLRCGLQVDLRVVAEESLGAALHYFTGAKAHSIALRRLAQAQGLKINEYGVFRGRRRIAGATEESVYAAVGLPYIPPELRENRGEIEAARAGTLPVLVERRDLRGDLHSHTTQSDGRGSLEDMARAAQTQGLRYLAITDHSPHLSVAHGLDPLRLAQQGVAIDAWNAAHPEITLLKGIEVDILEDGGLDLPDTALQPLDVVVGAVHSHFHLSRAQQTERILRALDHPYLTLLAHPTGRLIGSREAYDVDMARIIRKARACGCHLELNAQPERLDLADIHCQMARAEGVLVSINSDAHAGTDFGFLEYGTDQARRGWLERGHVLNTRGLAELRPLLRRDRDLS